jgi:hypothetical protein
LFVVFTERIQAFSMWKIKRNVLPFYFWRKFIFFFLFLNCIPGMCEHSVFGICRWTIKVNIEV